MGLSQKWCLTQGCGAREALGPRWTEQMAQQVAGWQQGRGGFAGPSVEPYSAYGSDRRAGQSSYLCLDEFLQGE